jgi:hypothetical protein
MTLSARLRLLTLLTTLLPLSSDSIGSPQTKPEPADVDCAFSNQHYSGWCRVTVEKRPDNADPRYACGIVLRCLNGENTKCAGNVNPCRAPEIRSGWKLEEAKLSPGRAERPR